MNQLSQWTSYREMDEEISKQIGNIATGFIYLGYLFKQARDTELFKEAGYQSIYEYVQEKYNITRTQALRFMQINDTYSLNGYSAEIDPKYIGYGSSKLTEMLGIPKEIREEIPAEVTVKELRSIKSELSQENTSENSCATVAQTIENTGAETEKPVLEQFIIFYFRERKQEFKNYYKIVKEAMENNKLEERITQDKLFNTIAPSKFKMVRIDGYNILVKEAGIKTMPLTGGENKEYTHMDFIMQFISTFRHIIESMPLEEIEQADWESYYTEPFEDPKPVKEEKKPEPAKKHEEKKAVKKAEPQAITKDKEEETECFIKQQIEETGETDLTCSGDIGEECETCDKTEPNIEEIPGQASIEDYPEYLPDSKESNKTETEKVEAEVVDTRKAAGYSERIQKILEEMTDGEIEDMSQMDVLDTVLRYHGIFNQTDMILETINEIYQTNLE